MNETTGLRPYERVTQPWTIPEREKRKVIEVEDEVGGQAKKLRRDDIRFFISSIPAGQKMNQSRDETRAVQGEQTGLEMGPDQGMHMGDADSGHGQGVGDADSRLGMRMGDADSKQGLGKGEDADINTCRDTQLASRLGMEMGDADIRLG